MSLKYAPKRGDVVWVTLSPQAGHEQAGRRPALVLSPAEYNRKTRLAVVCPITNRVKGYPFEVLIPDGHAVAGVVLADQVRSLDWNARDATLVCRLPIEVASQVAGKSTALLSCGPIR